MLGLWLVVSLFLWPHAAAQSASNLVVGVLVVACSIATETVTPKARFATAALAVWALLSSIVLPHVAVRTPWNDIFVSILILACSIAPAAPRPRARHAT